MKIANTSVSSLNLKGIYSITSQCGKRYIGHAKKSFLSRFKCHFNKLHSNNHQNRHLQSAWNKYGVDEFVFEVIEILHDIDCFECNETFWIAYYKSWDREKGYNINRYLSQSPSSTPESRKLISDTLKQGYKDGRIKLSHATLIQPGTEPWNKGKKYVSTDHLKVPKTISKKVIAKLKRHSEQLRESSSEINVFDESGAIIGSYRSSKDLSELSKDENFKLIKFMKLRFLNGKNGHIPTYLSSCNINKSCKTKQPYKGLIFKIKPCPVM